MAKKDNWTVISATVTTQQKEEVDRKAEKSGMTRNEYIIARLFHDKDDPNNAKLISDIDKRTYLTSSLAFILSKNIALEILKDPKKVQEIEREAIDNALQRGLMPSDYKPQIKK